MSHYTQRTNQGILPLPGLTEILGPFAISLEIFIRKDFGERYLSLSKFIAALLTLWSFSFIYRLVVWVAASFSQPSALLFGNGVQLRFATFMPLFVYGFILLCGWHFIRIKQRNRRNEQWYSWSFGISHLERVLPLFAWWERVPVIGAPVDNWFLYRFIEPGVFLVLSLILRLIDPILGTWLLISSVALLIKNNHIYAKERAWFLDEMDSQIRASYSAAATGRKPVQETKGFSVVPVPVDELYANDIAAHDNRETALRKTLDDVLGEGA